VKDDKEYNPKKCKRKQHDTGCNALNRGRGRVLHYSPGALYVLIALLLVGDPEGGASGAEAMDFYGLVLVSFWMSIVLLLDR